jgi:Cdc6-like AAA superfamily ATPase
LKALRVEQKTLQSIQEWFCKDDAQHHHDDIRSRQPLDQATAEWLFDGPEAVSRTFCQWRDGNDAARVLWATGDPAVGKTTVASQVIQHLRHHAATATTNSAGRIGIAWTYVNMAKTAEPQNSKLPAWILRSLIRILISQTSGIPASATDLVAKSKTAGRSPSNAELLSCLTSICEVAYDTVYFIIDGLDEASHDACYELIGHLKELPSNARCMLTSRYNQTLQNALPSPSRIHIRANRRDAELYFAQEVLRKPNFAAALRTLERSKPGAARRAQDAIVEKTDES